MVRQLPLSRTNQLFRHHLQRLPSPRPHNKLPLLQHPAMLRAGRTAAKKTSRLPIARPPNKVGWLHYDTQVTPMHAQLQRHCRRAADACRCLPLLSVGMSVVGFAAEAKAAAEPTPKAGARVKKVRLDRIC